jgi:MFS family permease
MLIPWLIKRLKKKPVFLIIVDLIIGLSFIMLGFATYPLLGIFLLLLIRGFGFSRNLIFVNGINRQIESENRATVLSTVNMFGSFLMALAFPFIGIIVEWNPLLVFIFIGVLILIFTLLTRVKNEDL